MPARTRETQARQAAAAAVADVLQGHAKQTRDEMERELVKLLTQDDIVVPAVGSALQEWAGRTDARTPRLLPLLYGDAVKRLRGGQPGSRRPSRFEEKTAAHAELFHRLGGGDAFSQFFPGHEPSSPNGGPGAEVVDAEVIDDGGAS
ncbi:hypothetical protein [Mycolicibacterium hippocampi]|uniref:hypothetical protein n=1 Tax=Mycolicibacterium hippocampi TaxID=659824 RepID=UPI001F331729|nr:hypothetical protein [Mycolicibacterium hippocampi]